VRSDQITCRIIGDADHFALLFLMRHEGPDNEVNAEKANADPAHLRNHSPPSWKELLSKSFLTVAVELPATAMGMEWPMPNSTMKKTPVITFC